MSVRLLTIALAVALLSACGSGDDVPDDQAIKPGSTPSGWTRTDLKAVTVAAPPAWQKGPTKPATETMDITTWQHPVAGGTSDGGLEVRVISKPQQKAEKAAKALAVSAMAGLESGKVEPKSITWPDAKTAFLLSYTATIGPADTKKSYLTRTFVLDLDDGRQVQVTSLAAEDSGDTKLPERVLSTVRLKAGENPPDGGGY
jgi:hypothetical protein